MSLSDAHLADAVGSWLGCLTDTDTELARRLGPEAEAVKRLVAVLRPGGEALAGGEDPIDVAARRQGGALDRRQQATVMLVVLNLSGISTDASLAWPPESLVDDLVSAWDGYDEVPGPWHLGVPFGLGRWPRRATGDPAWDRVLPLARKVSASMAAASVTNTNEVTVDRWKVWERAVLHPSSRDVMADGLIEWLLRAPAPAQETAWAEDTPRCDCGFHGPGSDGTSGQSRPRRQPGECQGGQDASRLGTTCKSLCCRHRLANYGCRLADDDGVRRLEAWGQFLARMVGGDALRPLGKPPLAGQPLRAGTVPKEWHGTMFARLALDRRVAETLQWTIPEEDKRCKEVRSGDPRRNWTPLRLEIGTVEFRECGSCGRDHEGERCHRCGAQAEPCAPRVQKENWLFVRELEGRHQYALEWRFGCDACRPAERPIRGPRARSQGGWFTREEMEKGHACSNCATAATWPPAPRCRSCGSPVTKELEDGAGVCGNCAKPLRPPVCDRCRRALGESDPDCRRCWGEEFWFGAPLLGAWPVWVRRPLTITDDDPGRFTEEQTDDPDTLNDEEND